MTTANLGLSLLAGILSTLSPCVLPLLPVVLGGAASQHRLGPVALAAGLALSFATIGLFVATIGFSIGLDASVFRIIAALMLITLGLVIAIPMLQERFAVAAGPIGSWADQRFGGFSKAGISGQFGLGVLLGAVWSPCAGPTLGAASVLAAQGERLGDVALTMIVFGIGAALPLLALGLLSREAMLRMRGRMMGAASSLKVGLGAVLGVVGVAILTGLDKRLETILVDMSPEWLTRLTTTF